MTHPALLLDVVVGLYVADNRVLLAQRHASNVPEWSEAWALPGGKVEFGETDDVALRREMVEELRATAHVGPLLCTSIFRTSGFSAPYRVACYEIDILGGYRLTKEGGQALRLVEFRHVMQRSIRCLPSTRMALMAYLNLYEGSLYAHA